jgi:hypothetical protein
MQVAFLHLRVDPVHDTLRGRTITMDADVQQRMDGIFESLGL